MGSRLVSTVSDSVLGSYHPEASHRRQAESLLAELYFTWEGEGSVRCSWAAHGMRDEKHKEG